MLPLPQMQRHFFGVSLLIALLLTSNICWEISSAQAVGGKSDKVNIQSSKDFFPVLNLSRPFLIHPQIHYDKPDEKGLHLPRITLFYYHQGQCVYIDLQLNDLLLPTNHFVQYQRSRTPMEYVVKYFTKTKGTLCHYQGSLRGIPDSRTAISTCNGGLNGVVFDGIETFFINSGSDGSLQDGYFLFRHSYLSNKKSTCGYNSSALSSHKNILYKDPSTSGSRSLTHKYRSKPNRNLRYKRSHDDISVIRGPYNADKHSSYVELVIVVDKEMYQFFDHSTSQVHQYCKDLVNIINAVYNPLNIYVVLTGVVIWNESNEIELSRNAVATLNNFLIYRRTKLVLEHPNDIAQLLTKQKFADGVVGKAYLATLCTHENSGGVINHHSRVMAIVATTMAHELGHNFGMEHDESSDCKCQDENCIMSPASTSVAPMHWSSCSIDQLNIAFSRGLNYCLRNKPIKLFDSPQCGNGFVEPGEQCDCGLPTFCENYCCDPYTCMLYTNASCATGECCDLSTCSPKQAGTACRGAEHECDLPEYCTGESENCPVDVFKRDTEECDVGRAYCFQGQCRSHAQQCRILWGSTGVSSEHCYVQNIKGNRVGNCGYNRLDSTFLACDAADVACGMLHCRHLSVRLDFGLESSAVMSNSWVNHEREAVSCSTALLDFGLHSTDPGLTPNGAKCGADMMCLNRTCRSVEQLRASGVGVECPEQCNGRGVCNSRGSCHCDVGYTGSTCLAVGAGGSEDSGPATNPKIHGVFQRLMYIVFAVLCFISMFFFLLNCCRRRLIFKRDKLIENMQVASPSKSSSITSMTVRDVSTDKCPTLTTIAIS